MQPRKRPAAAAPPRFTHVPGVGAKFEGYLTRMGFAAPRELAHHEPEQLYARLASMLGDPRLDRCVLYLFRQLVYYARKVRTRAALVARASALSTPLRSAQYGDRDDIERLPKRAKVQLDPALDWAAWSDARMTSDMAKSLEALRPPSSAAPINANGAVEEEAPGRPASASERRRRSDRSGAPAIKQEEGGDAATRR